MLVEQAGQQVRHVSVQHTQTGEICSLDEFAGLAYPVVVTVWPDGCGAGAAGVQLKQWAASQMWCLGAW